MYLKMYLIQFFFFNILLLIEKHITVNGVVKCLKQELMQYVNKKNLNILLIIS